MEAHAQPIPRRGRPNLADPMGGAHRGLTGAPATTFMPARIARTLFAARPAADPLAAAACGYCKRVAIGLLSRKEQSRIRLRSSRFSPRRIDAAVLMQESGDVRLRRSSRSEDENMSGQDASTVFKRGWRSSRSEDEKSAGSRQQMLHRERASWLSIPHPNPMG